MRTTVAITLLLLAAVNVNAAQRRPVAEGLLVRLYDVGQDMRSLPEIAPGQKPNDVKVVPMLDLRSDHGDFAPLEQQFVTEVSGYVKVAAAGEYVFVLISDDGAKLWLDDQLIVDHDGWHGPTPKAGTVQLEAGDHRLRVMHFNNGGGAQLTLQWRPPLAAGDRPEPVPAGVLSYPADAPRETAAGQKRVIAPLRRGLAGDGAPLERAHPTVDIPDAQRTQARFLLVDQTLVLRGGYVWPTAEVGTHDHKRPLVWVPDARPAGPLGVVYAISSGALDGQKLVQTSVEDKRIFVDALGQTRQGCVFRFGRSSGAPLVPAERLPFEMRAVRALANGFEIEFTQPLHPEIGWDPASYYVEQWPFDIAAGAAPTRDGTALAVKSASVSRDHKRIFLEIDGLKPGCVTYIRLLPPCVSEAGERPWSTEAWYTLNTIPANRTGEVKPPPPQPAQNVLTEAERASDWELLFDGRTTDGWRGYRQDRFPAGWIVQDGCLVRVAPAGDICTVAEYDNFELQLEWRISAGGNSGIFFRVDEERGWPWETGPEMQVLDNAEHADGRNPKTSAGSNYALHAPVRDVTRPVGFFNQVRIIADGPHIEHWLNGVKVVEYELGTPEWQSIVAESKFSAWPYYGRAEKGRIVLQDHGDEVRYRNIKIRRLASEP